MKPTEPKIVTSGDGSHTLAMPHLKEHYHSTKGAIQESEYVFIQKGLKATHKRALNVLEVGFGTGLNALLTALRSDGREVKYFGLEPQKLEFGLIAQLNYPEQLHDPSAEKVFETLHTAPWGKMTKISSAFSLEKLEVGLEGYEPNVQFDLVYYDAFAPHAQSELWELWVWEKLIEWMNPEGVLVTYCAKGQVRRDMMAAGFQVEKLPGPPGKREMLRCTKPLTA